MVHNKLPFHGPYIERIPYLGDGILIVVRRILDATIRVRYCQLNVSMQNNTMSIEVVRTYTGCYHPRSGKDLDRYKHTIQYKINVVN